MVDIAAYFVKSAPLRAFIGPFQHIAGMLQTLKMCMKKFDAEKILLINWQGYFRQLHIVNNGR